MSNFEALLAQYDYPLTPEQIALTPASPRDSAKLLVYDRAKNVAHYSTFAHLADFLPKDAVLVFNNTKVIPARIRALRKSGGAVEILCTSIDAKKNTCTALINKRLEVGEQVRVDKTIITVRSIRDSEYDLEFNTPVERAVQKYGVTPIPPYLKHTTLSESQLRTRYQSVFAKHKGSAAAPTASLHFTPRLMKKLQTQGVNFAYVTLHVGLGTFAPLTESALNTGALHAEYYDVPQRTARIIAAAKKAGRPIIPVGTTALRAMESMHSLGSRGDTNIFIREGYRFHVADGLVTNFHVPRSSLMMLVAALVGREKLLELYKNAAANDFRFLSFGDGMLVL